MTPKQAREAAQGAVMQAVATLQGVVTDAGARNEAKIEAAKTLLSAAQTLKDMTTVIPLEVATGKFARFDNWTGDFLPEEEEEANAKA